MFKLRYNIRISNPKEFEEWVKFSILNESQRKGITDFKHTVSRLMKIISDNKYSMPIGFNKHSAYGVKAMEHKREKECRWQELKRIETQRSNKIDFNNVLQIKNNYTEQALSIARKIVEISKVEIKSTTENAICNMINSLNTQLRKLIEQGADVKIVKGYLQKNIGSINNIGKAA